MQFLQNIFGFDQYESLDENSLARGYKCQEKVQMSEKTIWKESRQCQHIEEEECFITYDTSLEWKKVEECKDVFVKNCVVENKEKSEMKNVQVCLRRKERDGDQDGPEVCTVEKDMSKLGFPMLMNKVNTVHNILRHPVYRHGSLNSSCSTELEP